jgi:hypothetical protein
MHVILDPRYKLEFIEFRIEQAFGDKAGAPKKSEHGYQESL